ncbi:MAG: FG-GAP-like repeat-containing protein [Armatimonadaceae bacterium]
MQDNAVFKRYVIGEADNSPANMNTFIRVGDVDGDGKPDIVVGGRSGSLVWFENPGSITGDWRKHEIEQNFLHRECGGTLADLTGNGMLDVIVGADSQADSLIWWENPGSSGAAWQSYIITQTGHRQFHDVVVGTVTPDGIRSLVFWNQHAREEDGATLWRYPIPADVRQSPWRGGEIIATGKREGGLPEEGIVLADLDGDGVDEIVAGTRWYKQVDGSWQEYRFAVPADSDALPYVTTVLAVGDVNGDGKLEIIVSEGDPCIYGRKEIGGRLAWFERGEDATAPWKEHLLAEHLWDAHSLQVGDFFGDGKAHILVGEIGVRDDAKKVPRLMLFRNDGTGNFTQLTIDEGIGNHHAQVADLEGRGTLDIISRSLHGPDKWKVYVWRRD